MGFNVKRGLLVLVAAMAMAMAGCGSDESEMNIVGEPLDVNCSANQTGELLYGNSGNDVMKVVINGYDYGYIEPGQALRVNLDAGFQMTAYTIWRDGTTACSSATESIISCGSDSIICEAININKIPSNDIILPAQNGKVSFSHESHYTDCNLCHNGVPGKIEVSIPKDFYHGLCKNCHSDIGQGPTQCGGCHIQ